MSISRVKTWIAGEVLTASDLNAEFSNILNNPVDLWSPAGKAADMNGFELILDGDADTSITSDTDDRIDFKIAGTDSVFFGHATGNTGGFVTIDPLAFTATASTDIGRLRVGNTNALTVPTGTTAIAASLFVEEPNLTATGTITSAVTLYVEAAPTEGGTNNYALWVDGGTSRLDGLLDLRGGQVKFPASQSASADANTLDDYEEGTWTPVLTFATAGDLSVTYTNQAGFYTKVGRLVMLEFGIDTSAFTHTTASGACQITGVPFTSANSGQATRGALIFQGITKANFTQFALLLNTNSATLTIDASGSAQILGSVAAADMPTGGTVVLHGVLTYFV